MLERYDDARACAEDAIAHVGKRIVLGLPLGLGKANHLANAFFDIAKKNPSMSFATVYNTLKLFCERGLARTLEVDPARQFYDSCIEAHHHFFNVDTGELTDIPVEAVTLNVAAALPVGTEQTGIDVVIRVRGSDPTGVR